MSLITFGKGTVIGGRAVILGHLAEKGEMVFAPVKIGKKCLIGTSAQINPGCTIGDGAVIASRAVLKKYTHGAHFLVLHPYVLHQPMQSIIY